MKRNKIKKIMAVLLCSMMLMGCSMAALGIGVGAGIEYTFDISTAAAGYNSPDGPQKTKGKQKAYVTVTTNTAGFFGPETAFIVLQSGGAAITKAEVMIKGTGYVTPVYSESGANFEGHVWLRANAATVVDKVYTVSGEFYPDGKKTETQ